MQPTDVIVRSVFVFLKREGREEETVCPPSPGTRAGSRGQLEQIDARSFHQPGGRIERDRRLGSRRRGVAQGLLVRWSGSEADSEGLELASIPNPTRGLSCRRPVSYTHLTLPTICSV